MSPTRGPRGRHSIAVLCGILVAAGLLAQGGPTASVLRSDRVDGVHSDMAPAIAPIDMTGIRIELSSPSHTLEVLEHSLELTPGTQGDHIGRLSARIKGEADLVAVIEIGGLPGAMEDRIVLPEQEQVIEGRAELERTEEGYRITLLELPTHAEIQIDSDLAGNLVTLCQGFAVIPFMSINCDAVDAAMSVLRLPLPEPGEVFVLDPADLTEVERSQIDAYLDGSA